MHPTKKQRMKGAQLTESNNRRLKRLLGLWLENDLSAPLKGGNQQRRDYAASIEWALN